MPPVNQSVLYDVTERYRLRAEDLGKDPVCEIHFTAAVRRRQSTAYPIFLILCLLLLLYGRRLLP